MWHGFWSPFVPRPIKVIPCTIFQPPDMATSLHKRNCMNTLQSHVEQIYPKSNHDMTGIVRRYNQKIWNTEITYIQKAPLFAVYWTPSCWSHWQLLTPRKIYIGSLTSQLFYWHKQHQLAWNDGMPTNICSTNHRLNFVSKFVLCLYMSVNKASLLVC